MSCIAIPTIALPELPFPLTISPPALPSVDLSIDFCCKLQLISFAPYIPLGAVVLAIPGAAAFVASINVYLAAIDTYIDALPLSCPKDP